MTSNVSKSTDQNSVAKLAFSWISLGAVFSGLSVVLGAFGAHSLKAQLSEQQLATFHTATQYLGYHGLAILLVGILALQAGEAGGKTLKKVAVWFTVGIALFCGSLYVLALGGPRFFGPVTPFGGLCFIIGWFTLAATMFKLGKSKSG